MMKNAEMEGRRARSLCETRNVKGTSKIDMGIERLENMSGKTEQ